jgi:putative ABC transport system permease protein
MATFAAVGASPVRRRVHAMAQAATIGAFGTLLGAGLGALVGVSLLQGSTSYPFTVPVRWLAGVVLAAPVLAVVVAGLLTRSRLPLTRRLG